MSDPRSIELELRKLREELNTAYWEDNYDAILGLTMAIKRLEMLFSMGERFDVNH